MGNDEFDDYQIQITMSATLPIDEEVHNYINPIEGKILYYNDDKGEFELCGRLRCCFVNLEQIMEDGDSYYQTLDDYSGELGEVADAIFNTEWSFETNYLKPSVVKALSLDEEDLLFISENIVYIERLEILNKHRRKGVGIHLLNEVLTYLSKVLRFSLFVLMPFPLQKHLEEGEKLSSWKRRMALHKLEKDFEKANKKLRKLYGNLGFKPIEGSSFMVCRSADFATDDYVESDDDPSEDELSDYDLLAAEEVG